MPAKRVTGPQGQLYAEPQPSADETGFRQVNNSDAYYNSPYYLAHKSQAQPIPPPRKGVPAYLDLADFLPADLLAGVTSAKKISFHAVGDTGAAKVNRSQSAATAIEHEASVADAMSADVQSKDGPAFFFHLGDVIYNFGEGQYYYDQFYEPFRNYDRPIFAVPGNHDGAVFGQGSSAPQVPTLDAFLTNFCAAAPDLSPDSGSLIRSVMTQPGVYFTLDAPYVSIIGLYSNVLDSGGGVISSQGGHFPIVDDQLAFLTAELKRLKPDHDAGKRAVIIAIHHPPLSADARHGGSTGELDDMDACCQKAGLWPDLVLAGHAHLYQRFTRSINGTEIPYVVCGAGGYAATAPRQGVPKAPVTVPEKPGWSHTMVIDPIVQFGYLTITVDATAKTLSLVFKTAFQHAIMERDSVVLDLRTRKVVSGPAKVVSGPAGVASAAGSGASARKTAGRRKARK